MQSIVKVSDDPPNDTSGIVIPVTGMRLVTAAMFMAAWMTIIAVRPPATSRPKRSVDPSAILIPA